jgi:hypothetical protein
MGYGDIFPIVVSVSVIAFISRYIALFSHDMSTFLLAVFFLGILGTILEIYYFIKNNYKNYVLKKDIIKDLFTSHGRIFVASIIAICIATYFAMLWPSGQIEVSLTKSIDFYSWTFTAGYWNGFFEISKFGMTTDNFAFDAFGSNILYSLFSVAKGEIPIIVGPTFSIFLASIIGVGIYTLVVSIFKLPTWLNILITIGVIWGNLFHLVIEGGLFGQLVSLIGFIAGLTIVFTNQEKTRYDTFVLLFFVFLYISNCYQAGFLLFISFIFLAKVLTEWLTKDTTLSRGYAAIKTLKSNILVFFALTIIVFLLIPQNAIQLIGRTVSAAEQTAGYGIGFLDPVIFSGIPTYYEGFPFKGVGSPTISYFIFFIILVFLYLLGMITKDDKTDKNKSKQKITVIFVLFVISLAMYLIAYKIMGDVYQVWKFASYIPLPISFIFTGLAFSDIYKIFDKKPYLYISLSLIPILICLSIKVLEYSTVEYKPHKKNQVISLSPLIYGINKVNEMDKDASKIFYNFVELRRNFTAAILSQNNNATIGFNERLYWIPGTFKFTNFLDKDSVSYSDRLFNGLFNGLPEEVPSVFTIYRYPYDVIIENGAVEYIGVEGPFKKAMIEKVEINILMPQKLLGQDSQLKIYFEVVVAKQDEACHKVKLIPSMRAEGDVIEVDLKDFTTIIPKEWQDGNYFKFTLEFPGIEPYEARAARRGRRDDSLCHFFIKGVEMFPL